MNRTIRAGINRSNIAQIAGRQGFVAREDNSFDRGSPGRSFRTFSMKVVSSIKSAKKRHPACQVVRRKGRIYVINKVEPRFKARQG